MMLVEKSFDTGEVVLNYAEGPDNGPPLVLFPGLTRRWQSHLLPIIIPLSHRWHIYAVDNRGHGKSGKVPEKYRLVDYMTDAAAFVNNLNEPAVLFGHSLGGMILPGIANNAPDNVKAAIFGDPPLTDESLRAWMTQDLFPNYFRSLIELKESNHTLWEMAEKLGGVTPWNLEHARTIQSLDPSVPLDTLVFEEWVEGYDMDELVKGIRCPVLLLQGDPSIFSAMTDKDVEFVKEHVSDVVHVCLDNVDHGLGLGDWRADQVISAMYYFLESLR